MIKGPQRRVLPQDIISLRGDMSPSSSYPINKKKKTFLYSRSSSSLATMYYRAKIPLMSVKKEVKYVCILNYLCPYEINVIKLELQKSSGKSLNSIMKSVRCAL